MHHRIIPMLALLMVAGCNGDPNAAGSEKGASTSGAGMDKSAVKQNIAPGVPKGDVPTSAAGQPDRMAISGASASASARSSDEPINRTESKAGGARAVAEESELYDFEYSYPAQAGKIPLLRALLDSRLDAARSELRSDAVGARKEAVSNGFPYNPYAVHMSWKIVADLPGWLALKGSAWSYGGGAHGNSEFSAIIWDKEASKPRDASDLFKSRTALNKAVKEPFCKELNKQRAERRDIPAIEEGDDPFSQCTGPLREMTLIPASTNRHAFNRLTFLIAPYAVGPYVEGTYEVTLPVTQAVIDTVKPEFAADFTKAR